MKKTLFTVAAVAAIACCSCTKELEDRVGNLEQKVEALEAKVNANVASIEQLAAAAAKAVTVTSVEKSADGYTIHFSDGQTAVISNGVNGKDGADGVDGKDAVAPTIGFKEVDGVLYWTVNGELLKNGDAYVPVTGKNGSDGTDGQDGKTPQFKIQDGVWKVSFDGETWTDVPVTGTVAPTLEMTETETEYVFTLGETVVRIPKYQEFAIKVTTHAYEVQPKSEIVLDYTVTGADESVVIFVEAVNVTAKVDEEAKTITVSTGDLVESGYVFVKAVRNSDGKYSAQYINIKRGLYGEKGDIIVSSENEYLNW